MKTTRRATLATLASLPLYAWHGTSLAGETAQKHDQRMKVTNMTDSVLDALNVPGIRGRIVHDINGLSVHVVESGYEAPGRPIVLLLHGFPETSYSWRKVMLPLANAGYHVIAPDQRGYGKTTGWDPHYDGDMASFRTHAFASDALGIVMAMGYRSVAAVVGHDFGAMVAAYCALVRPDVFQSLALISFPFDGPPTIPFDTVGKALPLPKPKLDEQLAALPRPRKDSMTYFSSRNANDDMAHAKQGLHDFLRGYYFVKSADWQGNHPYPLRTGSAEELAQLPTYYIMDRNAGMAQTVAPYMSSANHVNSKQWLPDSDLAVYVEAFRQTGFQGGLNWFRCHTGSIGKSEIDLFSGRMIDVPSCFIAGRADWGTYRKPGALERMQQGVYSNFKGIHLIDGAGHWVQQEQPERFNTLLLDFLQNTMKA